jgi:energy-coupling factor transport system ATP-binding protein
MPAELAGSIAYVGQNPSRYFVAATVFDELAFAPKQLNLPLAQIEPIAKRFGLTDKFQLDPRTLSAGWQQRVAIAAALTSGAKTILLDEPFSMLDSDGREVLVKLLSELKALGYGIAIAEHRTSLLRGLVDEELELGEPVVRKKKTQIRMTSAELHNFQRVSIAYGSNKVFDGFEVSIPKASVSTVTGPNGSGKSSLLRALANQNAALVPQPASDLLFMHSVLEELDQSDRDNRKPRGTAEALLTRLVPEIPLENNPADLSEGQKLALAIAIQLGHDRPILLLDEPTVGFDDAAKNRLSDLLLEITKIGKTVLLATHDHEFAKGISSHTIRLGGANVRQ